MAGEFTFDEAQSGLSPSGLPLPPPGLPVEPGAPPGMLVRPDPRGRKTPLPKVGDPEGEFTFQEAGGGQVAPSAQAPEGFSWAEAQPLVAPPPPDEGYGAPSQATEAFSFESARQPASVGPSTAPLSETFTSLYPRTVQSASAQIPGFLRAMHEQNQEALTDELKQRELLDRDEAAFHRYIADPNRTLPPVGRMPRSKEQILADMDAEAKDIKLNQELYNSAQAELNAVRPKNEGLVGQGIGAAAESSPTTLAGIALSIMGLGGAGVTVAVGGGAAQQYVSTYNEARDTYGATNEQAHAAAVIDAALEAAGEKLGFGALTAPGKSFIRKTLTAIAVESGEEMATQLGQDINAKLSYNPNLTVEEVLKDLAVAGIAATATGGTVAPVHYAGEKAAQAQQERQFLAETGRATEQSLGALPTPEAVAVRNLATEQPPPVSYAQQPYSLRPAPAPEVTTTHLPPELQVAADTGIKLPTPIEEAAQYRKQLEAYGAQPPMPLLPYEEKELAAVTKALTAVEGIQDGQEFLARLEATNAPAGTITRTLIDDLKGDQHDPYEVDAVRRALQLLNADYTTRALTGEPFANAGQNQVQPWGLDKLGVAAWSTDQKVKADTVLKTDELQRGHAYVLARVGTTPEEQQQLIVAAKVMRQWLDKMGFKDRLNLAIGKGSPTGSLGEHILADENSLLIDLTLGDKGKPKFWSTAAHELGHGLAWVMLSRSSPKVQAAIRQLWANDTRVALGMQSMEAARQRVTGATAGMMQTQTPNTQLAGEYTQGITAEPQDYQSFTMRPYYFSYTEWLAHRFERMLQGNFLGMQQDIEAALGGDKQTAGVVMRFLQGSWNRIKTLFDMYKSATPRTEADDNFEAFIKMHARLAEARTKLGKEMLPAEEPQPTAAVKPFAAASAEPPRTPGIAKATGRRTSASSRSYDHELDKFGWFRKTFGTLLDLSRANSHIESLNRYMANVLQWANEKMNWVSRADLRLREWRKLLPKQRQNLTAFLFDQTQAKKYFDLQDPAVQAKYPLSPEALDMYRRIKSDFEDFNSAVEETLVTETLRRMQNNLFVQGAVADIRKRFADMRSRPYFPMTHFGPYYTLVRNAQGKVVAAPSYDTRVAQKLNAGKLARSFPGHGIEQRKASSTAQAYAGLRPELLDALKDKLDLTGEQRKALDQYLLEIAPAQSYAKHMIQRKFTPGFTFDAQRQYAAYFQKGAGFMARVKYGQKMREAVREIEASAKVAGAPDSVTRQRIADYAAQHLDYLITPQNEWTSFRAGLAVMFLGVRLPTALVNMTQPAMFTYPYLAARYGDLAAISAMQQAYADLPKAFRATKQMDKATAAAYDKYSRKVPLTPAEEKLVARYTGLSQDLREALTRAQKENVIDQSQAMELAAIAEGNVLTRSASTSELARLGRMVAAGAMYPFQLAENVNRRVTFMAAYRLAERSGMDKDSAYNAAVDAVRTTQFEYGKWNRPELMRGKKGVMFMFMTYQLSALRFLLGGDPGWWRGLAILFLLGGLEGLPFAQDLLNLATWMLSSSNERFDAKLWLKKQAEKLGSIFEDHPDLLLQGVSRYAGPVDLSGSLSLGRLMPGAEVLAKPGKWDEKLLAMERDVGGAFTGLVLNSYRAATDSTMPLERRLELGMPLVAAKDQMVANRWLQDGAALSMNGTEIADVTPTEIGIKALGFSPRSVTQAMEDLQTKNDFVTFYTLRRSALTTDYDRAVQTGDRDEINRAVQEIRDFNAEVPVPGLRVNMKEVLDSHKGREKGRRAEEAGAGRTKIERAVTRGLRDSQF